MEDVPISYNPGLILTELERRFYLYLVGGDYEKLFYSFVGSDITDGGGVDNKELVRVKLDVEISKAERKSQSNSHSADPAYKALLDRILDFRIKKQLVLPEELLGCFTELTDILSFFSKVSFDCRFSQEQIDFISNTPWLSSKVNAFFENLSYCKLLGLKKYKNLPKNLSQVSPRLFVWLLQRWFGDLLLEYVHPSLTNVYRRVRFYSRVTAGSIIVLGQEEDLDKSTLWQMYTWGSGNVLPICVFLLLISKEIELLVEEQVASLNSEDTQATDTILKRKVLDNFRISDDSFYELLKLEEVLKPVIIETVNATTLNEFILLSSDPTSIEGLVFRKAKTYAFYRQLFRSGRIKKHEMKVLLSSFDLGAKDVINLNEHQLASFDSHLKMYKSLFLE